MGSAGCHVRFGTLLIIPPAISLGRVMRPAPYTFIRYQILDDTDERVSDNKHFRVLDRLKEVKVPHRKREPTPADYDTFLFRVKQITVEEEKAIIFDVAKHITIRMEHRVVDGDLQLFNVGADDTQWTRVVMVPRLGVAGVRDGSGEQYLSATSAISRLQSIFRHALEYEFLYEQTGRPDDVSRAVERLGLTDFSFTVKPFNPHPRTPGLKLHDLMEASNVGRLKADATPKYGSEMDASADEGIIQEALGLAESGYGQFGFRGRIRKTGSEVSYKKPKFENTREANLARRNKPAEMRALVSRTDSHSEEDQVVMTIVELYGR